ncbi:MULTISPECIES: DUF317 domain-containing protein [unclassified Kitasatospora]|uniref:DUF317 domain-containing protein n=1 Tax=unclassified Kitasatospora TaxID=2633591 RepID=UPI000709DF18|nr:MULTISPECIES: DUF317 domain-containing protein [unclassified Kitasatospora]KQV20959.1 hypothetical protein ASC99_20890 [Kitasatospora sp. Root107]KRB60387.1 hypothetical protein ASE03_12285 [Kitasatospora sp. Root187]
MTGDRGDAAQLPSDEQVLVIPGYLAGPGDLDTANTAFGDFLAEHQGWARYSCDGGDTSVAISNCLTSRIQLAYEPGHRDVRWTVAGYESPVGERAWNATFDLATPYEIPLSVAETFSYVLAYSSEFAREEALWGRVDTRAALLRHLGESDWQDVSSPDAMAFQACDGTAGLTRWDRGAYAADPAGPDSSAGVTLWGRGPAEAADGGWKAHFSEHAPTRLITAALDHLTDPQAELRRRAEIPVVYRGLVEARPAAQPARVQAASRHTLPVCLSPAPPVPRSPSPPVAPRPVRRLS